MEFPDTRAFLDYKNVEAYLAKQVPKANWGATIINIVLAIIMIGIASIMATLLRPIVLGLLPGGFGGTSMSTSLSSGLGIEMIIGICIINFILFFIHGGIMHLIAKAFGGTGKMMQLLYLMSMVSLAMAPILVLFDLIIIIPCVNCIVFLFLFALVAYIYYLYYLILKIIYKLESGRAILAMVAYFVVGVIISIIIYITLFVLWIYMLGSNILKI